MRKKEMMWVVVLLVLGGIYVHYFTHWFEKRQIGITASFRPSRHTVTEVWPVVFTLDNEYKLTSLKVVPLDGTVYNPAETPVWQLVSDSNSVPVRAFRYGQYIGGMKPALKGIRPSPLMPDVVYRLELSAGSATGHTDFKEKSTSE